MLASPFYRLKDVIVVEAFLLDVFITDAVFCKIIVILIGNIEY